MNSTVIPKPKAKRHHVISPDGFPISHTPFKSREAAEAGLALWIKRFEAQGYYSTGRLKRIPLSEIADHCYIEPA